MPMLLFDGGFGLILFAVWIFCIIDVITTPEAECRNLPKWAWLLIVIILDIVGGVAWLVAGRNWGGSANPIDRSRRAPMRTGRPAKARASNPDDDEEFLASLRARAEEQRRRGRDEQRPDEPPAGSPPA
jgi:hypothetical protein